jgi:hypothetical protein
MTKNNLTNFILVLPILAKQQADLPTFVENHRWFLERNGRIFIKSSGEISDAILSNISSDKVLIEVRDDRSIYDAWNQCLEGLGAMALAEDTYVTFLGIDDLLSQDYIDLALTTLQTQPDLDFLYGNSVHDLKGTTYLHESPENPKLFGRDNFLFDVPHPGMFNRWGTIKNYRFDTQFRLAADFDFYIGIALSKSLKWRKLDMVQATLGGEGISASLNSKQIYLNEWAIIEAKRGVKLSSNKLHTTVTAWIAKNPLVYKWLRQAWWKIKSMTR